SVEIVFVGALDLHRGDLADAQGAAACDVDGAVDLGRVALAAALRNSRADFINDHLLARADLGLEPLRRDRLLALHEAMPALLLPRVGHTGREIVRDRAVHRLVFEAADAIELRFAEPVEQQLEVGIGFARKADDEGRAQGEARADLAPAGDAL